MPSLSQLLLELRELKQDADAKRAAYDAAQEAFKTAERRVWDYMEAEGTQSQNINGVNFVRQHTTYAQVQDAHEFEKWAQANGYEDFFESKPRKKLLNELVRERMRNSEPLPPGIGFYENEYIAQHGRKTED